MPAAPTTRRSWFQFSLGTLLVVITLLTLSLGALALDLTFIRKRRTLVDSIVAQNRGKVFPPYERFSHKLVTIPRWREWLGDEAVDSIELFEDATPEEVERVKITFPEAFVRRNQTAAEEDADARAWKQKDLAQRHERNNRYEESLRRAKPRIAVRELLESLDGSTVARPPQMTASK
jgi:hypothetical protein